MLKKILFTFVCFWALKHSNAQLPEQNYVYNSWSVSTILYFQSGEANSFFKTDQEGKIPVLFQSNNNTCFGNLQFAYSSYGSIASARLTKDEIINLSKLDCINHIEVCGTLNSPRPLADTVRIITKTDKLHKGVQNGLAKDFTGKGVVVGIIDIGFQNDNPNFYNNDGTGYRIKRFWDQGNNSGTKPTGYTYGTEYSITSQIQSAKNDDGTHGTHVAGISSGSGFTTPNLKFAGMAPESDLVFVSIKYANDTLGGSALGDLVVANPTILDAYKYVFDYAKSQQKPAVCNLSWGMHAGPHDGNSLFDKAVESLTGRGKLVVGANGNDGGNEMHALFDNAADTQYTFMFDRSRNDYPKENVYADFWGEANKPFALNCSVFDTSGNLLFSTPFYSTTTNLSVQKRFGLNGDTVKLILAGQSNFINNQKGNILVIAESNNAQKLRLRIGVISQGKVHAWNSGQAYRWTGGSFSNKVKGNDYSANAKYLKGDQYYSMGENGGTGKATISIGANVARKDWKDFRGIYHAQNWLNIGEMAGFSSRGPTVDGRIKPDLSAPGQLVASSVNRRQYPGWFDEYTVQRSVFAGDTQMYTLLSGTSMASPVACGIVALLLQADPTLNPDEAKAYLYKTAIRDNYTGPDSNVFYGYGKINAFESVKLAYENYLAHANGLNKTNYRIFPNPAQNYVGFELTKPLMNGKVSLFSIEGKLLISKKYDGSILAGNLAFPIKLSKGVYLIQIEGVGIDIRQKLIVE